MSQAVFEPSLKGRPVFFVRPHSVVQNELLADLIRSEYSVAVLADHTKVLQLFRLHPDCIAFLNIDEGYPESEWETQVRKIEDDPDIGGARIGIMTYNDDPELSQKYLLELMVSCGFIKLSLELGESTKTILRVLDANEAKGRRQFLRVLCQKGSAGLNLAIDNSSYVGSVADISSVGMACVFDVDPGLKARSMLKDVQLKLKGVLCQVTAVVMGSRQDEEGKTLYVLLFAPNTFDGIREKIRVFMRKTLQWQLEADLT